MLTYDPTHGRQLYVNGIFTGDVDTLTGGTLGNWDNTFAFLLGNETSDDRPWQGEIRFAAVHNNALDVSQIQQNYAAGVGQLYYLLFDVSALTGMPQSYIMFTASQYDNYSYLFDKPTFISLNPKAQPGSIPIQGMRIGINGQEAAGRPGLHPRSTPRSTNANYSPTAGQLLSTDRHGDRRCRIGPASDQFFLTFAQIGTQHACAHRDRRRSAPTPTDLPASSDIGLRVYDEVNASMAKHHRRVAGLSRRSTTTYQTVQTAVADRVRHPERSLPSQRDRHLAAGDPVLPGAGERSDARAGVLPGPESQCRPRRSRLRHHRRHGSGDHAADQQSGHRRQTSPASRRTPQVRTELYSLITDAGQLQCQRSDLRADADAYTDHHQGGLRRGARQRHDVDQVAMFIRDRQP